MALHVMEEANRCLQCKKTRCQQGCPIHTNIPEVIRLLKEGRLNDAGWMLFENNPLTTVATHQEAVDDYLRINNSLSMRKDVPFNIRLCELVVNNAPGSRSLATAPDME